MLLHTVNKSPDSSDALASCLRAALPGSQLLLIEDGVYAARDGNEAAGEIAAANGIHCYALEADIRARGLQDMLAENITVLDYAGFVRLSTECHAVQSWY